MSDQSGDLTLSNDETFSSLEETLPNGTSVPFTRQGQMIGLGGYETLCVYGVTT